MLSEIQLKLNSNSSCGFRLTGGVKFGMPLTVFEVEEGSCAQEAGIRLGDTLTKINGMEADNLNLEEAQKILSDSGEVVTLEVSNIDYTDEDIDDEEEEQRSEKIKALIAEYSDVPDDTDTEHSGDLLKSESSAADTKESIDILSTSRSVSAEDILDSVSKDQEENVTKNVDDPFDEYVDVNSLELLAPRPPPEPEKAKRKCWHPVMLDTSPPPIIEESTGEMQNGRCAEIPEIKDEAVAKQLRSMQKQLEKLSTLPATIQATLDAVNNKIVNIISPNDNNEEYCEEEEEEEYTVETDIESDVEQTAASGDLFEEELTASFDILTEEDDDYSSSEMENYKRPASQSESESSMSGQQNQQEIEKYAKQQKLETLNKCWPWGDTKKEIYKIAEHYEPVYAKCIGRRVKWMEKKIEEEKLFKNLLKAKAI